MTSSKCHTLILGGAKSGKSAYALELALKGIAPREKNPCALFIATAAAQDQEMQRRIEAHKKERGPEWHTIEEEIDIANILKNELGAYEVAVVDCLTMWVSNLLINAPDKLETEIERLVDTLHTATRPVVLVSSEVGMGIVPDNRLARRFTDTLGLVNQKIAFVASRVILMAAGIPMVLKDELTK